MTGPSARLRQARESAGFASIADVISRFGWKRSNYSHHENGIRKIGIQDAIKYGRAFRVSGWWLLTGIVEPKAVSDLSSDELLLIEKYRGAPEALRGAAHSVLTPTPRGQVTPLADHRKTGS